MFLKSKANNSIGYCTLPMLNIDIKLEYIIDINNDINDTLVLKFYNTGLAPSTTAQAYRPRKQSLASANLPKANNLTPIDIR